MRELVDDGVADDNHAEESCLVVTKGDEGLTIKVTLRLTLKEAGRQREAINRIATFFRKGRWAVDFAEADKVVVPCDSSHIDAAILMEELTAWVAHIAERPLTPRMVCASLGITATECRKWSKKGRLPIVARARFRVGRQLVHVPQFAPNKIFHLLLHPEIIDQWRRDG